MINLVCVEFYGEIDPTELIGAVDVPAGRAIEYARKIGKMLCLIRKRNALNAVLITQSGEEMERMMIFK